MRKAALHNLGCKVNAYESDAMQQLLEKAGYEIVSFREQADVYIINTCSVTNIADRKSRQMLHRAKSQNPEAVVVAAGCYAQSATGELKKDPSVDLIIGNNKKGDLVSILDEYFLNRKKESKEPGQYLIDIAGTHEYEPLHIDRTADHTRAFIKVQDGCNQFCSYCIIPYTRGRVRSRRPEEVEEEVRSLAAAGYREVVLTGIHLSSYGADFSEKNGLLRLIQRLHPTEGISRIRLGSLEPGIVTEEFAFTLAGLSKVCPHFHLSLQSGCDETLKRMNRHYTAAGYEQRCRLLKRAFDNPAVTTDVIVGFPGETEEEFARTKAFLEEICFYEMHIFKYSRRSETRAASMPNQIPESVKARRSEELLELEKKMSLKYRRGFIGKPLEVLLEEETEIAGRSYLVGHTREYVKVAVPKADSGSFCRPNTITEVVPKQMLTEEILS